MTKFYLTCSSIIEKLEKFISMELCKAVESSSGLIEESIKSFNMFIEVFFLSVSIGTFMPSELKVSVDWRQMGTGQATGQLQLVFPL